MLLLLLPWAIFIDGSIANWYGDDENLSQAICNKPVVKTLFVAVYTVLGLP
jgi:hypothetical protein